MQACAIDFAIRKRLEEELNNKIRDLEIFSKAAVSRELRIIELKNMLEELRAKLKDNI